MIAKRALGFSLCLTGALVLGLSSARRAQAQVGLPPGTTTGIPVPIISAGAPPFGGSLIQELSSPIFGTNIVNTISGTVSSAVFRSPAGFLDFAYQFRFDPTTNVVLDAISLSSFKDISGLLIAQTSDDIDGATGLPAESSGGTLQNFFSPATATGSYSSASRANINGNGINATFLTGVTGGESTYTFLIRTQATGYSIGGSASVQGGGISAFTPAQGAFVPLSASAPEPGTLALIVLGGLAVGLGRRRQ
jgi:PEP-CTERM motif